MKRLYSIFSRRRERRSINQPDTVEQSVPTTTRDSRPISIHNHISVARYEPPRLGLALQGNSQGNFITSATSSKGDDVLPQATTGLYSNEPADLTDQVLQTSPYPVFEGIYSNIFIGEWHGNKVAIKVVRGVGSLCATRRRLSREKKVWSSLSHHSIIPLYGYCERLGEYGAFISPWYANGDTGRHIRQRSVSLGQRLNWWCDIIEGVTFLHAQEPPVIHGDLKPHNVLIDDEGRARLCDFGLVRSLSVEQTSTCHSGTIRYRAHELVNTDERLNTDEQVVTTTASDIHALGCIALELVFLQSPYAGHRAGEQVFKEIYKGNPPATHLPILSEPSQPIRQFWAVLEACWNRDPLVRPSALQLQHYISSCKNELLKSFRDGLIPAPAALI